jgi:hypothetical protein
MKSVFVFLVFLISAAAASANPFDSFPGEYSVVGTPVIQKSGEARECIRFGFQYLVGFSVIADTTGYHQSYMLHFNFNGGSIGTGWFGHPIMDYGDPLDTSSTYAKTTGDSNLAQNEWTSTVGQNSEPLIVSIQRDGRQFILKMTESYIEKGVVAASCLYQATLVKK